MKNALLLAAGLALIPAATPAAAHDRPRGGDEAMIAARIKIFGAENVDPRTGAVQRDKVVMSWLTHTTAAISIDGEVVLADTFIARLETKPGRTPFVIQDVVDLKPKAIFIGHGHGDHADNAAYVAVKSGARLYASEETCGVLRADLARMKADPFMQADPQFAIPAAATINCINVTTTGSTPGTQIVRINVLEPDACIVAFRHLHSIAVAADPDWPEFPAVLAPFSATGTLPLQDWPDPRDPRLYPPGDPLTPSNPRRPGQQNIRTGGNPGGAVSIWFHIVLKRGSNFTIAVNNTVGALKEGKGNGWDGTPADGQRVRNIVRSLPYTDVQFGTASSGNTDLNGWRDHVDYLNALRPRIFLPGHAPVGAALQYHAGFLATLKLMEQPRGSWPGFPSSEWPEFRWLTDPTDTLKPMVFDVNDPAWDRRGKSQRIAQFCGGNKGHDDDDDDD
jgi:L-ascorbate metabolism protein UlaG (beta-lactamase superfamily)